MKFTMNLILAAAAAMTLAAGGALLDGPSDADIERATAADLADAKLAAQRFERDLRACKKALGPSADLVQIERTGDYVCREQAIEPTPAEILHRYADLSGRKL
jgi:hypothetical protein